MKRIIITLTFLATLANITFAQFAGGDGTQANPWQIKTATQLNNVRNYLNPTEMKHFKLMNDIDLKEMGETNNWVPYKGWNSTAGAYMNFDGNGHVIKNMNISGKTENYQSFAGYLWGKIQNLGLVDVYIDCPAVGGLGAFVGYLGSATPGDNNYKTGIIENCYATGYVSGGGGTVGGIAGTIGCPANDGTYSYIKNCYFSGELYNTYTGSSATVRTGGIAGYVRGNENALTLVSYNVKAFSNNPAYPNGNYQQIADFLQSLHPDVVALQELDSANTRSKGVYQLKRLSELTGWNYRYARTIPFQGGSYGIGIVSPRPIVQSTSYFLTSGDEQRAFVIVEFDKYIMICTHLDLNISIPKVQAQEITTKVRELYGNSTKPVFLAGDFNSTPNSETLNEFRKNWIQLTPNDYTVPADAPNKCIDYIFMFNRGQNYEILQSRVINNSIVAAMPVESDHLPVIISIVIY